MLLILLWSLIYPVLQQQAAPTILHLYTWHVGDQKIWMNEWIYFLIFIIHPSKTLQIHYKHYVNLSPTCILMNSKKKRRNTQAHTYIHIRTYIYIYIHLVYSKRPVWLWILQPVSMSSTCVKTVTPSSLTLLHGTQEVTKLALLVFPCRLFFIKKQNNGHCLRSRGWTVAESRAAGPGNRAALYSVESPRRSLALDPDPAGCERPPRILRCVRAYRLAYVHVCFCCVGAPGCSPTN